MAHYKSPASSSRSLAQRPVHQVWTTAQPVMCACVCMHSFCGMRTQDILCATEILVSVNAEEWI